MIVDGGMVKSIQQLVYDPSNGEFAAPPFSNIKGIKTRVILASALINAFLLDNEMIAIATCKGFIILDREYKV